MTVKRHSSAFTLIELLVAVAILAILSTLVLANMNSARERGRDARRKNDLHQLKTALRLYYNDNQAYPDDDGSGAISGFSWGSNWTVAGTTYMNEIPQDPLSPTYSYYYDLDDADDNKFSLKACLENKNDDSGETETNTAWCPTGWRYAVASD